MKWRDKRDVTMLSTFHDDTFIEKRRRTRLASGGVEVIQKPSIVEDKGNLFSYSFNVCDVKAD